MIVKMKYYIILFLLWKTRKQLKTYEVFEELYNFIKNENEFNKRPMMHLIMLYQLFRYEDKIEKNLSYIEKLQK